MIYEYQCMKCAAIIEENRPINEADIKESNSKCPNNCDSKCTRILSKTYGYVK